MADAPDHDATVVDQRAMDLFRRALDVEPPDRVAFVEATAGEDTDAAARACELLAALADSDGFLETPALAAEEPETAAPTLPESIGGYRIDSVLGDGGWAPSISRSSRTRVARSRSR